MNMAQPEPHTSRKRCRRNITNKTQWTSSNQYSTADSHLYYSLQNGAFPDSHAPECSMFWGGFLKAAFPLMCSGGSAELQCQVRHASNPTPEFNKPDYIRPLFNYTPGCTVPEPSLRLMTASNTTARKQNVTFCVQKSISLNCVSVRLQYAYCVYTCVCACLC